jgi:hypothetical protein
LAATTGCYSILKQRVDRNESSSATFSLLANRPFRMELGPIDGLLRREPRLHLREQPILLSFALQNDDRRLDDILWLALSKHYDKSAPALQHRVLALYCVGNLFRPDREREPPPNLIDKLLEVIDRDPNLLVQHAAAVAAIKAIPASQAGRLTHFVRLRPELPTQVRHALSLAAKIRG